MHVLILAPMADPPAPIGCGPSGAAARPSITSYFSDDTHDGDEAFYHRTWQFFTSAAAAPDSLSRWLFENTERDRTNILSREVNHPLMLTQFCNGSLSLLDIPDATNVTGKCAACRRYQNGCPAGDPGFADAADRPARRLMLGSGLNCMTPAHCVQSTWLAALEKLFLRESTHLTKDDLFQADGCNMPFVERRQDGRVLTYMAYRYGLYVDLLMRQGHLLDRTSSPVLMEVGAGWGGFAALVKKVLPNARYIILDIPTSLPLQMSYLRSLGFRKLYTLKQDATREDLISLLCCTPFDFLFLLPRQIELLPDNAVELTVNLDSMVEMPRATVEFYIQQIARFSQAFYANNREGKYNTWRGFSLAVRTYMTQSRRHPWNLVLQNRSWVMPSPHTNSHMSAHVMMHGKAKHIQLFLRRRSACAAWAASPCKQQSGARLRARPTECLARRGDSGPLLSM